MKSEDVLEFLFRPGCESGVVRGILGRRIERNWEQSSIVVEYLALLCAKNTNYQTVRSRVVQKYVTRTSDHLLTDSTESTIYSKIKCGTYVPTNDHKRERNICYSFIRKQEILLE